MNLFEQIQADRIQAMRIGESDKRSLLGCVIAEATKKDKTPDNDTVLRAIRSMLKGLEETLSHIDSSHDSFDLTNNEIEILKTYLPQMASENELRDFIEGKFDKINQKMMGQVMGAVKKEFGSKADMKIASQIVRGLISD